MTYPGNSSLPNEVKDRVLSTFEQTLNLFRQGRMDEVSAGCDLLLKMDPMFAPARQLLEKSRNPMAPIDIDNLLPAEPATNDPISQAREALSRRDFQRALDLSTSVLSNDFANEAAQSIATEAQERIEAAPFVQQFVKAAQNHLASGNMQGAKTALEKARTLDDMHPAIVEVQKALEAASAPGAPPPQTGFGPTSGFGAPSWQSAQPEAKPSFDFSDAFVVDSPPGAPSSSPGATPATDFGFTFEEEAKPAPQETPVNFAAAFGSSGAAAEPPVGEASTFDFSMASVDVSPEDQAKITTFLAEGDEAYASNDYQKAIDIWSRIFLIDVTNEQASERIERARKKRMEIDERIDEAIVAATHAFERKEFDTARRQFEEVLTYDPDNQVAQDYLGRLDSAATAEAAPVIAPTPSKPLSPDLFEEDDYTGAGAEILRPPTTEPKARPTQAPKVKAAPAAARDKRSMMPIAIGIIFLAVLAGGYFAYTKLASRSSYDASATEAAFAQAQILAKRGQFDQAIGILSAIKPGDPQHDRALEMIADLKNKKSSAGGLIDGRPAAEVFRDLVSAARAAYESHDYLAAKQAFERAASIQQLPANAVPIYQDAMQQVAKLDAARALFKEGRYADAITNLQALLQQDPTNPNIHQLVSDAHFDLGRTALAEERTKDAAGEFELVLANNPSDELAKRSRELALRYDGETKDLLYRIYVKYLPLR